jgi:hypothetical protein
MSASAPLGRPSRNTGSVEAVCTSATSTGLVVNVVISQAAATSFIHIVMLAASQASQSMRKTGVANGASAEVAGAESAEGGSLVTDAVSCE